MLKGNFNANSPETHAPISYGADDSNGRTLSRRPGTHTTTHLCLAYHCCPLSHAAVWRAQPDAASGSPAKTCRCNLNLVQEIILAPAWEAVPAVSRRAVEYSADPSHADITCHDPEAWLTARHAGIPQPGTGFTGVHPSTAHPRSGWRGTR